MLHHVVERISLSDKISFTHMDYHNRKVFRVVWGAVIRSHRHRENGIFYEKTQENSHVVLNRTPTDMQ